MLLLTLKENLRLYRLPSFSVNHRPLGFPSSGTRRTMSGLPGERIDSSRIFTSGSRVSAKHTIIRLLVWLQLVLN